jgi:hypothetical protein
LPSSHCPDGKIADVLARLTIAQLRTLRSTLLQLVRATDTQTSHRPHGKVADALASTHASTTLWPTLRSTTVGTCRRDLKLSHRPDGKIADVLAPTHACKTAADASVNNSLYVPQRLENFTSPRWENALMEKLLTPCHDSHLHNCRRHSGQLQNYVRAAETFCEFPIAPGDSRVARCLQGGGVYVQGGTVSIVNSQIYSNTASQVRASHACKLPIAPMGNCRRACTDSRLHNCECFGQLQSVRATETLQFPIAPMEKWLTWLPRLTLAQLRTLRSTTVCTCHRDLENFPSPQLETHVLLVVCRAVVSLSREAQ